MDFVFHAVSGGALALYLGEKRPGQLLLAGAIGVLPDTFWPVVQLFPDQLYLYSFMHSLLFNIPFCLIICTFNWQIAFGGILHIVIDVFTHQSSTYHILFPFSQYRAPIGIDWWSWPGLLLWGTLWFFLLIMIATLYRRTSSFHS